MYQTLYRKYRPRNFSEIVGQDSIVKILKNSIKNNHISHAYLFIGPRGTGKTSTAKIFARAVNCLNSNDGDICGKCDGCLASINSLDIIEMDAASNRKIDNIRDLIDKVNIVPSTLKYKVYIIDEVHMLTNEAFNALLKTIEEPPDYVIFILATTDPQKVPATIVSRCQCFNFNRISENNIVNNLRMISENENIKVSDDVLKEIAIISDGGMRDSISLLDKVSSFSNKEITLDEFLSLNGLITNDEIDNFIKLITENKFNEVVSTLESWNDRGTNILQVMIQLLNYLKDKIVNSYVSSKKINESYLKLANLVNNNLSSARLSSNPKIYFEILFLNFMDSENKIISREIISDKNVSNKIVGIDKNGLENNISQKINSNDNVSRETIENKNNNFKKNISREIISDKNASNKIVEFKKNDLNNNISQEIIEEGNPESDKKSGLSSNKKFLNSNIKEIMKIRVNNAFCEASKSIKNDYISLFKKLYDFSIDPEIGGICGTLCDGKIAVASKNLVVITFDYEGIVVENYPNISKMESIIKDKLGIVVKIAIISVDDWKVYKDDFIKHFKNNEKYDLIKEPELVFNKENNVADKSNSSVKVINNDSNLDEFSDILDVEN